jgi:hypothetical protein
MQSHFHIATAKTRAPQGHSQNAPSMDGNLDLPSASRLPAPEAAAAAPFAATPAESIPTAVSTPTNRAEMQPPALLSSIMGQRRAVAESSAISWRDLFITNQKPLAEPFEPGWGDCRAASRRRGVLFGTADTSDKRPPLYAPHRTSRSSLASAGPHRLEGIKVRRDGGQWIRTARVPDYAETRIEKREYLSLTPTQAALIRSRSLEGSQVGSPRSIDVVTDEAAQRRATGDLLDVATGSMSLVKEPLNEQPMASTRPAVAAKSPALTPPRAMRSHCSSSSAHTAALVACGSPNLHPQGAAASSNVPGRKHWYRSAGSAPADQPTASGDGAASPSPSKGEDGEGSGAARPRPSRPSRPPLLPSAEHGASARALTLEEERKNEETFPETFGTARTHPRTHPTGARMDDPMNQQCADDLAYVGDREGVLDREANAEETAEEAAEEAAEELAEETLAAAGTRLLGSDRRMASWSVPTPRPRVSLCEKCALVWVREGAPRFDSARDYVADLRQEIQQDPEKHADARALCRTIAAALDTCMTNHAEAAAEQMRHFYAARAQATQAHFAGVAKASRMWWEDFTSGYLAEQLTEAVQARWEQDVAAIQVFLEDFVVDPRGTLQGCWSGVSTGVRAYMRARAMGWAFGTTDGRDERELVARAHHVETLSTEGPRSDADPNAEAEAEMDTVAMAAAGAEAKSEGPRHAEVVHHTQGEELCVHSL